MPLLLFLLFLLVPLVELYVIIQVGELVGVLPTIALLLAVSIAGAWLVKREGLRAWRRFRTALGEARLPATEVVDGALVLLGGALMLTPGFVTDAVGLLLVVPLTRAVVNRVIRGRVRFVFGVPPPRDRAAVKPRDETVDVEVLRVERNERE